MEPAFVDFGSSPARTGGGEVRLDRCRTAGDHLVVDAGGGVEIDFPVPEAGAGDEATLRFRGLAGKLGDTTGYAPVDVTVNGTPVLTRYLIPGGGGIPHETWWAIPRDLLATGKNGKNTLRIAAADDARGVLWLYRILLESAGRRNSAETALFAAQFTEPVLTYRTSRRAQGGVLGAAASVPPGIQGWQDGLPLTVYIDSAERGLPAQLGWRSRNGAEGSVSFAAELNTFHGHWRSGAGQWHEYRGTLTARAPAQALARGDVQRFATQASWGDTSRWHDGQPLELRVDTGDGPLDRLHWRDQRESCASIGFSFDGTSFIGWSQRLAEGPVAYRGTLTAAPEPEPGPDPLRLQPELEEVVKAVGQLADSAARRLSSWMNQRWQDHS